jgi:glycosyltransferase involved in cell wall biosynthesis
MRIGINALLVSATPSYRNAGISRYTLSLLHALRSADAVHEYTVFVSERAVKAQLPSTARSTTVLAGPASGHPTRRVLWEQFRLPGEVWQHGLQLLHAPMNILPLTLPCPGIVTMHDLAFLRFPEFFRPARRIYQQLFTRRSARRATMLIAVSHQTRQDLIDLLGVPEERIRVIHPILEERFCLPPSAEALKRFRQQRRLPERSILFLGTLEPRKNIRRLIEAYSLLKREAQLPHMLLLAGARGWYEQGLEELVRALGIQEHVRFVGYVPEEEKVLWYHAADLFVYPSRYEGFGLPVAEAMACGVPVVTSNVSSLPEVVGDDGKFGERAGLLVSPDDTESLARAMRQGLYDMPLRQQLRERGRARARRFAPARIVPQIIQAYQDATELAT